MNYWKDKKVLVTGANGFVGSHLVVSLLGKGAYVVGLVYDKTANSFLKMSPYWNKANIESGSVEDYDLLEKLLKKYTIDTCFHLAAQSIVAIANSSPLATFRTNIMGSWNILEACRNTNSIKRIIIASTDKSYGEQKKLPYTEGMRLLGRNPYDVSKACVDMLAQSYYKTFLLPIGISRCVNIYGPGDLNFSRIVPDTMKALIFNKQPIIRSDGTYIRDYIYIKDAVRAYTLLAEKLDNPDFHGESFNFASEQPIKVLDLIELIINISGKTKLQPIILGKARNEIKKQYLSSQKARKMLDWKNEYNLKEGLKETYLWYRDFLQNKK